MTVNPVIAGISSVWFWLYLVQATSATDFLSWIDDNVALAGVVTNVDSLGTIVSDFDRYRNKYWDGALDLAMDTRFPILSSDEWEEVKEIFSESAQKLGNVRELAFAIHEFEGGIPQVTLLFKSDSMDELLQLIDSIKFLAKRIIGREKTNSIFPSIASLEFHQSVVGQWLVLSNSKTRLQEIASRISSAHEKGFKSLRESRKFKSIAIQFTRANEQDTAIQLFGNPSKLRTFFPVLSDETWDSYQVDEMPCFGIQIIISARDLKEADEVDNWLLVDARLSFTNPPSGLGRQIAGYRRIESIPPCPGDVVFANGECFDPVKLFEAKRALYEGVSDESYVESLKSRFDEALFSDVEEILSKKSNSRFFLAYTGRKAGIHSLSLEGVEDKSVAFAYLNGLIKQLDSTNSTKADNFVPVECNLGILFARPAPRTRPGLEYSFLLSDDWILNGRRETVLETAQVINESSRKRTRKGKLPLLVKQLGERFGVVNAFFKFEFQSFEWTSEIASEIEYALLARKFKNNWDQYQAAANAAENEYGYRLNVETEAERNGILKMLLVKGMRAIVGDRVTLYSQADGQLRIVRGYYRTIEGNE